MSDSEILLAKKIDELRERIKIVIGELLHKRVEDSVISQYGTYQEGYLDGLGFAIDGTIFRHMACDGETQRDFKGLLTS